MNIEPDKLPTAYASAKLFQALVEQCADGIIFADRQGLIRVWNSGAEAIFGYASSEALGQSLDLIIPESMRNAHWSAFHQALLSGHSKYGRKALLTRSMRKDGGKLYVELSFALVSDSHGEVIGSVAAVRDVTSRQLAAKAARDQQP